ncbi:MAG: flippase-like domain-containing protein [Acidimicrobiales bacterium]
MSTEVASKRRHGIQFFAAPSDAARVRRVSDLVPAVLGSSIILLLVFVAADGTTFDAAWADLVAETPDWIVWLGQAGYTVGLLYGAGLVMGVGFVARGRLELLRDLFLAGVLAVGAAALLSGVVDDQWPEVPVTDLGDTTTTFPAFLITALVAVEAAAGPHLSAPARRLGGWIVAGAVAGAVIGGVSEPSDVVAGLFVGLVAAALVRLAFGTSAGVPSLGRISDGLEELGTPVDNLQYAPLQPRSSTIVYGSLGGEEFLVRVLGRDAWDNRRSERVWRFAWYQDARPQYGSSPREQVEHEALVALIAKNAGVAVGTPQVVGVTSLGDAIIGGEISGTPLSDFDADDIEDGLLAELWSQVKLFHAARLVHGRLSTEFVLIDDGRPTLSNFVDGSVSDEHSAQHEDVAELLASLALLVGSERAIASVCRAFTEDELADVLPVMQPAALSPETKHAAHKAKLSMGDLRDQLADEIGVEVPELEKIQRVSVGGIAMTAVTVFAAYLVISGLADVGLDTIVDSLADADWGLVLVALVLTQMTNGSDAVTLAALSPKPVPIGVTTLEQLAIGFINLVTPSAAGRVAMNIRFFQRFGISSVTASTTALVASLLAYVAQAFLLLLTLLVAEESLDLSGLETDGAVLRLVAFAVVIIAVAVVVVMIVPKWRHWLEDTIRKPLQEVKNSLSVLRKPKNAIEAVVGALTTELLYAGGLMLCVIAVGESVSLGEVLFINIFVSFFAGLMPVPGGVGVAEAGLTAGLTAVGVDPDSALAAVIIYRLCTNYLPPIWGWVSFRWLTHHHYL